MFYEPEVLGLLLFLFPIVDAFSEERQQMRTEKSKNQDEKIKKIRMEKSKNQDGKKINK